MIKKSVFEEELIRGMEQNLSTPEAKVTAIEKLAHALDCLHGAMEIFEEKGMSTQADACQEVMIKIAKKGNKLSVYSNNDEWQKLLNRPIKENTLDLEDLDEDLIPIVSEDGMEANDALLYLDINDADLEVYEKSLSKDTDNDDEDFEDE